MIYLNNNSTTKPSDEVINDFVWCVKNHWANPSDLSTDGIAAKNIITHAQEQVANYIGAEPNEIVFTSGGSESNNWALKGYVNRYKGIKSIITTEIEHPSVYNTCLYLKEKGYNVVYTPIDSFGEVDVNKLEEIISENYLFNSLVSIMMVNNEIGTINNIDAISKVVHKYGGVLHVDAVQAFGHIPIDVKNMGIDMMSVSFHKFGGFKNCGFLYINKNIELSPLIHGGHQFDWRRAGTENVPMIYALGNQVERLSNANSYITSNIIRYLYNKIYELGCNMDIPIILNGNPIENKEHCRLNNNLSLTFGGINAESLITLLDMKMVNVSAGSACCSGEKTPSRVLKAIGLTDEECFGTVRISVSENTSIDECDEFIKILDECLKVLVRNPISFS